MSKKMLRWKKVTISIQKETKKLDDNEKFLWVKWYTQVGWEQCHKILVKEGKLFKCKLFKKQTKNSNFY